MIVVLKCLQIYVIVLNLSVISANPINTNSDNSAIGVNMDPDSRELFIRNQILCGDRLTKTVHNICSVHNSAPSRRKRQIANDCCKKREGCSFEYLTRYCASIDNEGIKRMLDDIKLKNKNKQKNIIPQQIDKSEPNDYVQRIRKYDQAKTTNKISGGEVGMITNMGNPFYVGNYY
ncbi:uncharacterized protein LOC126264943 isoform X3 [Aethina tumida]|uniref:uncharacterized protein LOC126264943 isoform X3 n=1 Tax=Aethina tumida TaxID=116153 RepID=UPI0021489792|nr:uncharacterized protein LOC126264943 isoform X3 [Aethina tumida]